MQETEKQYLEEEVKSYDDLSRLAKELVMARRIAESYRQVIGKSLPGRTEP